MIHVTTHNLLPFPNLRSNLDLDMVSMLWFYDFMPSLLSMQVSLYLDKFSGVCQSVLHECKLTFLQIICDHDLFVEMPGRDPSDRYCFDSVYLITYVYHAVPGHKYLLRKYYNLCSEIFSLVFFLSYVALFILLSILLAGDNCLN